jgi:hypothetical protein
VAPVDGFRDHFVVGLQQDVAVFQVLEEGLHHGLDVERVEPQREDAGLALALGVEVVDVGFFLLGYGVEPRVGVEEVGDEGEVELWVAGDEGGGRQEFAAVEAVGVVEDLFGALVKVGGLERPARACVRRQLVEEDGVVFPVFDVFGEVGDAGVELVRVSLELEMVRNLRPVPFGVLQMVVEPP